MKSTALGLAVLLLAATIAVVLEAHKDDPANRFAIEGVSFIGVTDTPR